MVVARKISGWVSLLSLSSGVSLVFFGGGTLLLSAFGGGWDGALIGAALTGHGVYELRQRGKFLEAPAMPVARKLAWNQAALSGSVLLYLAWQVKSIDRGKLAEFMAQDFVRSALDLLPPVLSHMFRIDQLPRTLITFYGLVGVVVLIGSLGMASLYTRSVKNAA